MSQNISLILIPTDIPPTYDQQSLLIEQLQTEIRHHEIIDRLCNEYLDQQQGIDHYSSLRPPNSISLLERLLQAVDITPSMSSDNMRKIMSDNPVTC